MSSTLPDGVPAQAPDAWPAAGLLDPAALACALLDAMAEAFVVVDQASRIVGATPPAGALAGLPPAALLGRPLWDVFPRPPDDPWRVAHARVAAGGGSATIEVHVATLDRWYEVRTVAIAAGVALFWTDVTARHHTSDRFVALEVATGQAVWITDADGAVHEVLPSWLAFTGQTLDASMGWGWLAAMHPDDRAPTRAAFGRALQGEGDHAHVVRIRRHDGAWRRLLVRAVPVRDGAGAVREWIGVNLDVTDDHMTREALRVSEERLRYAMDGGEEGLWDWDVATGAVYFSPAWYRMLGYGPEEVTPTVDGWRALVHPDDLPDGLALMSEHLDGRIPVYQTEHRMRRRDGTWAWIMGRGRVVAFDAAGQPRRVVGLQADVSARKLSEAMLLERTRQLELGMRAAGLLVWKWELRTDAVTFEGGITPAHVRVAESTVTREDFLRTVYADDRASVRAALDAAIAGGPGYAVECRVVDVQGRMRWVADHGDVLHDASGVPVAMVGVGRDITEEREREQAVRASEARLQLALAAAHMGTWEWDAARDTTSTSETLGPLVGQPVGWAPTPEAFLAQVHPDDRARVAATMFQVTASPGPSVAEFRVELPDGAVRHLVAHAVAQDVGGHARVVGALADATERVRLEDQLRQAQKMEAVGQLAGGIAHDFNNLLTVIGGNLGFVRADLPSDHATQADLVEIARAADRARALVRQLLAFSRKQVLTPRALDLNEVVRGAEKLLRRVIGEEIVLETALARDVGIVCADAGQLDQVLLNLAVNARDAMLTAAHGHPGTGGTLTLETRTIQLDARAAVAWPPLVPGRYVCLVVRDSGHGMDPATRAHAFEPFFTTKPVGVGTGLGLATVYGIVAQSGGAVRLESTVGQGSTITILLPEVEAMGADDDTPTSGTVATRQQGLVLLVEDEATVRTTARRILERHGYAVLEARHGADALLLWRAHRADVRAVVTDLRMPEMGGPELASVLRGDRPDLPLVLVTGYADQPLVSRLGPRAVYVEKPFTGDALLAALRQVLAAEP